MQHLVFRYNNINLFILSHTVPPPTVNITVFSNHHKTVGGELLLGCNVTRASGVTSIPQFVWMKNGTPVEEMNDNRIKIHNYTISSSLQFVYLSEDDEGVYNCSVTIRNTSASGVFSLDEFDGEYNSRDSTLGLTDIIKHFI